MNAFSTTAARTVTGHPSSRKGDLRRSQPTARRLLLEALDHRYLLSGVGDGGRGAGEPGLASEVGSGDQALTGELIGRWQGEGDANDSVGTNHGILRGDATFAPGRVGQAFSFDGAGDSVEIPGSSALNARNQVSVAFWMLADASNAMDRCCQGLVTTDFYGVEISPGRDPRSGVNFFVNTDLSGDPARFAHTSDLAGGGLPLRPGQWHYIVGTYDGSNLKLYVDGQLSATTPHHGVITDMRSTSFLAFGSEDGRSNEPALVGNRYFRGLIDEVELFGRALSADEVLAAFSTPGAAETAHNEPPICLDSAARTDEDTSVELWLQCDDAEGGRVTYTIVSGPQHGTLTEFDPTTGRVLYTPKPNYHGRDEVTVNAVDADGIAGEPSVLYLRIDPVNDAPTASHGLLVSRGNTPEAVDLGPFAVDLETSSQELQIGLFPRPGMRGMLELEPDGRTVRYTPDCQSAGRNYEEKVAYSVRDTGDYDDDQNNDDGDEDPLGSSGTLTIEVHCNQSQPPVASSLEVLGREDTGLEIALSPAGFHGDGTHMTFSIVRSPEHGEILTANPATGAVTYRPAAHWNSATEEDRPESCDSFDFTLSDGELRSEPAVVTVCIEPVNDAVVAGSGSAATAEDSTGVDVELGELVQDVETPAHQLRFTVPSATNGVASLLPGGRTVRFVPDADFAGEGSFTYCVNDTGDGDDAPITTCATVDVTVAPQPDPPRAVDARTVHVREAGRLLLPVQSLFRDPDAGGSATWEIIAGPMHSSCPLDTGSNELCYVPRDRFVGVDSMTIRVTDNAGQWADITITLQVTALTAGFELADGVLTIIGTSGPDTIRAVRAGAGFTIETNFGTYTVADRATVSRVVVLARGGHDQVNLTALPAELMADVDGGTGHDEVTGGRGSDILRGGPGRDTLNAGNGDDLIIGGTGRDHLLGGRGDDLLLHGTLHDPGREFDLVAVLDEWLAAETRDEKLAAAQDLLDALLDDGTIDSVTGGSGADLLAHGPRDRMIDESAEDWRGLLH